MITLGMLVCKSCCVCKCGAAAVAVQLWAGFAASPGWDCSTKCPLGCVGAGTALPWVSPSSPGVPLEQGLGWGCAAQSRFPVGAHRSTSADTTAPAARDLCVDSSVCLVRSWGSLPLAVCAKKTAHYLHRNRASPLT